MTLYRVGRRKHEFETLSILIRSVTLNKQGNLLVSQFFLLQNGGFFPIGAYWKACYEH